jgi:hypothetical protein
MEKGLQRCATGSGGGGVNSEWWLVDREVKSPTRKPDVLGTQVPLKTLRLPPARRLLPWWLPSKVWVKRSSRVEPMEKQAILVSYDSVRGARGQVS